MDEVLRDLNCFVYLYDVFIVSANEQGHLKDFEKMIQHLSSFRLVLSVENVSLV